MKNLTAKILFVISHIKFIVSSFVDTTKYDQRRTRSTLASVLTNDVDTNSFGRWEKVVATNENDKRKLKQRHRSSSAFQARKAKRKIARKKSSLEPIRRRTRTKTRKRWRKAHTERQNRKRICAVVRTNREIKLIEVSDMCNELKKNFSSRTRNLRLVKNECRRQLNKQTKKKLIEKKYKTYFLCVCVCRFARLAWVCVCVLCDAKTRK